MPSDGMDRRVPRARVCDPIFRSASNGTQKATSLHGTASTDPAFSARLSLVRHPRHKVDDCLYSSARPTDDRRLPRDVD